MSKKDMLGGTVQHIPTTPLLSHQ